MYLAKAEDNSRPGHINVVSAQAAESEWKYGACTGNGAWGDGASNGYTALIASVSAAVS